MKKALLACVAAAALFVPVAPSVASSFDTGLLDAGFQSSDGELREELFDEAEAARAGTVRLILAWRGITSGQPLDETDPNDPAYHFAVTDAAVRNADARGMRVLLTITGAPDFAEGPNRPGNAAAGTWKPDPEALGRFAEAVAERYSGTFAPPSAPVLPRVRYLQAWNEGNLNVHLSPQYQGGEPFMPDHYRKMLNAFYEGVHASQPDGKVVATGTAPYGDEVGGPRTRPLAFWREVFCLEDRVALEPVACPVKPKLDVLAHHPINTTGSPFTSAANPDDSSTPDFKFVRAILRKAEKVGHVLPKGRGRPLWATELWWESKPADHCGLSLKTQARYLEDAMKLLRKQGASLVIWLSVRDQPAGPEECGRASLQSGLTEASGKRKPAFRAFRRFG